MGKLDEESKNISVSLGFLNQFRSQVGSSDPNAKVGNRRRVKRDSLSAELVESGGSQNNLGSVNGRGKDTEFGLLSSHVEAGNTGTGWGSRSRGVVGHGSLRDNEGGSHLRVEGVGSRQDEGEQKEDVLVGLHGYYIFVLVDGCKV